MAYSLELTLIPHIDTYRNGIKLVSATELPSLIGKPFLSKWQQKLCQCRTHREAKKTAFKQVEKEALEKFGEGHCGLVYADYVKDAAGDLGNEVHKIIEYWFNDIEIDAANEAGAWAKKIINVCQQHNVKPSVIKPEEVLIDAESGLAGSPDLIMEWDGRIEIGDYKIKNQLDDLTGMQGCAYRYLIRRLHNVDIRYMRIFHCRKAHKDQDVKDVLIDLDEWTESWIGLTKVWNKLNPKREVKILG